MPVMGRGARLLSEIVGVAVGGILVVAALAIWRLSEAPIEAKFIRPYLEQAVDNAGLGITVDVGEAKLGWHRFQAVLDLHLRGVTVMGQDKSPIAAFEDATVWV